ncbi:MAG: matrixin family metalloprotease [Planctomycetaceae bacterium]|nr:matrixin family metalloprotease [Planctomycetaceae bacterium]
MFFPRANDGSRDRELPPIHEWLVVSAFLSLAFLAGFPRQSVAQNESLTYSYSNLLDGNIELASQFDPFEMILAVEEGLGLWANYIPLDFIEQPDGGNDEINDAPYLDNGLPQIRIGHHGIDGNTLAHAYSPGGNGLSYDVHMDSSDRRWTEQFFLTVVTHELGHTIGIDHIDQRTAIMNTTLGSANGNLMPGIGDGYLFQADIDAAQGIWGIGTGQVVTKRVWTGDSSTNWSTHENWDQGWRPTSTSDVTIRNSANLRLSREESIRSLTVGGGKTKLEINGNGKLSVRDDVLLGSLIGGDELVSEGDSARVRVATNSSLENEWFDPNYDDSAWDQGSTGVGYDAQRDFRPFIGTDLRTSMQYRRSSFYTRIGFDVENREDLEYLGLFMRYDDGFVAYLNGVEIAAANAPDRLAWNSEANGQRDDDEAITPQLFEISDALPLLVEGRNLLAIQGLNASRSSSDLLVSPQIVSGVIDHEVIVDRGALDISGNLSLAEASASRGNLIVNDGSLRVAGDLTSGDGQSSVELRGGTIRVEGHTTPEVLITQRSETDYWIPQNGDLGLDWTAPEFDDGNWDPGPLGIGYDEDADYDRFLDTNIQSDAQDENSSFYTRTKFEIANPNDVNELILKMRFDDGFVAFLNGNRIAEANGPNNLRWNSRATRSTDDDNNIHWQEFDLSEHVDILQSGTNVLAIQGLNVNADSSDLLVLPELSWRQIGGQISVDSLDFYEGQILDVESIEATFRHQAGTFSPSQPGSHGSEPGQLIVIGDYVMKNEATLEFSIDGKTLDQHDSLIVNGLIQLAGTLSVAVNENGGSYTEPGTAGESDQIILITADNVEGQFDTLLYDDQPLVGHQQAGLFRSLQQSNTEVSLISYRAFYGDADGDGKFNSSDFIQVFQAAEYEDNISQNSDWTEGDWSGDMEFTTEDLVLALQTGRYESDPAFAIAVPEPISGLWIGFLVVLGYRRHTHR